jgi:hypothetical protein
LLRYPTHKQAAEAASIAERTLRTWLGLEEFQAEYMAARRRLVDAAGILQQRAAVKAVRKLIKLLDCGKQTVECRAAELLLTGAAETVKMTEFSVRLERLERELKQRSNRRIA